jgi:hypothetical protein
MGCNVMFQYVNTLCNLADILTAILCETWRHNHLANLGLELLTH